MSDAKNLGEKLLAVDVGTRRVAAESLAHMGADALPAAVSLVRATCDEDEQVREWAVAALEELPAPSAAEASSLAKLLSNQDLDVAYWAATLLGRMKSQAASAVDSLTRAVSEHPQSAVRQRAAWALGQINPA